ncbi:hypothetical protein HYQ45_005051 [Verticillium longisporum]|uniref:Uncharacterized protein n=1 Tax=Verticillium longisporum TaxID=100787 RepID=A0A8I2ZSL3_VERLO|nr:hypothetical protein HYQ45_005051 [Verticillium longisporum]
MRFISWWYQPLGTRAFLVLKRTQRFYNTFIILAALVAALAVGALTFPEFHPTTSTLGHVAEGFFTSSSLTAVVSAVVAIMLHFMFQGVERATRLDLAVSWAPLVLLDLSIVEFLLGMACWYASKNTSWRGAVMAAQTAGLLGYCLTVSAWVYLALSRKGGLDTS